jgi:hypothetical protein
MDTSGKIAETPTVIHNVTKGIHTVTFSRIGHSDITIMANVPEGSDCHARAVLDTSKWPYPMMMSEQQQYNTDIFQEPLQQQYQPLQQSPGWPYLPVQQVTYGHMVTSTSPDGAETYLDGQPVRDINGNISTTQSSITGIITGIHTVTFRKVGYRDANVTVNIQNGMYSDARATLQPITR